MRKKLNTEFKPKKEKMKLFGVGELSASAGPTIQLNSNKEASIEGCLGVMDYYENLIKLRISGGVMIFSGQKFNISSLTDNYVEITGEIDSIEFVMRDKK